MKALSSFAPSATLVFFASFALAVVSGCDSDDDSGSSSGGSNDGSSGGTAEAKHGCALLTREEAAAAAKNAVKEGKEVGIVCIWEPENLDDDTHLQLSVAYRPIPEGVDPNEACQAGLAGIPESKPFPGGPGDSAYWEFGEGGASNTGSLHVCLPNGFIDTSAIGKRPEAELQQIAVSIANTAISRL